MDRFVAAVLPLIRRHSAALIRWWFRRRSPAPAEESACDTASLEDDLGRAPWVT